MTRLRIALLSLLSLGGLAALPGLPAWAGSATVTVYSSTLSPSAVDIEEGDSVLWSNQGENVHNIVGTSSNWPSGERYLYPGASTAIQFYIPGEYSYSCEYHPSTMRGYISVAGEEPEPEPTESPSPEPTESAEPTPTDSPEPTPSASTSPTPVESASPTTATPSPTTPTELPEFGELGEGGGRGGAPAIASGAVTPPPDSPLKPPLTILVAIAVVLLVAGNPLLKPRNVELTRPKPTSNRV